LEPVAFLVTLLANGGSAHLGLVSILPIMLCAHFGIPWDRWDHGSTQIYHFLFLGGLTLAIAIEKTRLHEYFSNRAPWASVPKDTNWCHIRL